MNAVTLRLILIVALVLATVLGVGIFVLGSQQLKKFATEVQSTVAEAKSSDNIVSNLQLTDVALEQQSEAVERAAQVVAESQSYSYQDQIITDLNAYAKKAGISITGISFDASADATPQPTTGLKSTSATVSLRTPFNYSNFLRFISYIENNLTKMQIRSIALQKDSEDNQVAVQSLTIEVYIR